jgi:hypothetical protein
VIRPGPDAIEPGAAPGGIVFRVYEVGSHALLAEDTVMTGRGPSDEVAAAAFTGETPVVLVVYDGDTGLRFTPEQLAAAGLRSGQRL